MVKIKIRRLLISLFIGILSAPTLSEATSSTDSTRAERFEFYQLLPGMEVVLPEAEGSTTSITTAKPLKPALKSVISPQPTKTAVYIIQADAYRQRQSAEKLNKHLKRLGFKTHLQAVEAEDGHWFRVILGPFVEQSMAVQQKKHLQKYQIHGILILQRS